MAEFFGRKFDGSIQVQVPLNNPNTVVLTEDHKGRSYLRIRNIGGNPVAVAFSQSDALGNGEILPSDGLIEFPHPSGCPDGRVTATAIGGDTVVSVVYVRHSIQ